MEYYIAKLTAEGNRQPSGAVFARSGNSHGWPFKSNNHMVHIPRLPSRFHITPLPPLWPRRHFLAANASSNFLTYDSILCTFACKFYHPSAKTAPVPRPTLTHKHVFRQHLVADAILVEHVVVHSRSGQRRAEQEAGQPAAHVSHSLSENTLRR